MTRWFNRVRQVIEPMLAGLPLGDVPDDDRRFVQDLGLVRRDPAGGLVIANPIYHEVIPRALAAGMQDSLPRLTPTWLRPDGRLDPDRLLGERTTVAPATTAGGRSVTVVRG